MHSRGWNRPCESSRLLGNSEAIRRDAKLAPLRLLGLFVRPRFAAIGHLESQTTPHADFLLSPPA